MYFIFKTNEGNNLTNPQTLKKINSRQYGNKHKTNKRTGITQQSSSLVT